MSSLPHAVTVGRSSVNVDPDDRTTDAEGRLTITYTDLDPVAAYVGSPSVEDVQLAGQRGQRLACVAQVEIGTVAAPADRVTVDPGPVGLDGVWRIVLIRPTPRRLRLLCERWSTGG